MDAPTHGDHWQAAVGAEDPRLMEALALPPDAGEGPRLHRRELTGIVDLVQVTARRRLVTAYPEPRATALVRVKPRELLLWETGAEGWLVADEPRAGTLTVFLTDLAGRADRYQTARGGIGLEIGGLAYTLRRAHAHAGASRLRPGRQVDDRLLPDDYWFEADVVDVQRAGGDEVLELEFQGGLRLPVASRGSSLLAPGERAQGLLWLSGRWPEGQTS